MTYKWKIVHTSLTLPKFFETNSDEGNVSGFFQFWENFGNCWKLLGEVKAWRKSWKNFQEFGERFAEIRKGFGG